MIDCTFVQEHYGAHWTEFEYKRGGGLVLSGPDRDVEAKPEDGAMALRLFEEETL